MKRLRLLFIVLFSIRLESTAKMIDLDWSTRSNLFDNGYHTTTIFARLNDLLRFRCSSDLKFQIHLMKPLDALGCVVKSNPSQLIGFCGPNTSDPRLAIRSFALVPNQPTFQADEIYYFVAVGNNSKHSYSTELCENYGMRMRLHVLAKNAELSVNRIEEDTKMLLSREQQKADTESVHHYNRNLQNEQQKQVFESTEPIHSTRDSHEDNQSIRDKPLRHRGHQKTNDDESTEYDQNGRGRLNSLHNQKQIPTSNGGSNEDLPYHFRPISANHYSLPSKTIGYDYVIGYDEDSNSSNTISSTRIVISSCLLSFLLLRIWV